MFRSIAVTFSFPFIQAKEEYERKERKKEQARLRGEGTWMLSSVTDRINEESRVGIQVYTICTI